jgi:hypothetical protein
MSHDEKRQLTISSDAGGAISFERDGNTVSITQTVFYRNHQEVDCPIVLDEADRRKLMDFLNMGEYRALSYEESR